MYKICDCCKVSVQRRLMHHHLDFDCSENEIKCTKCKDKFKKKDLDKHVKMECQYSKV